MEIKHKELFPDKSQPFLHCKLDRQKYAGVLTSIVQNYADGFVLALNGEWGTGKTTFVRMWQASLEQANYKTIYFNAWENDFENEPLTALLGELKKTC
jgi:predicted KAP-like P-loop ATPase